MTPPDPSPLFDHPNLIDPEASIGQAGLDDRQWIKTIVTILQGAPADPHPNPRVQFALDRLHVAACERAIRLLSSDVPPTSA